MNYLAKMRILTLLFTLLRKCKSKPEVELWFIRKNYFFSKVWIMWKIISKRKITTSIYFTSNSRVLKINKNIYHNEVIWWLTCQFQADFPLLNPLIISENQRFRISDVFNGYRREKLAWNGFLKKLLPTVELVINSLPSLSIGFSPFYLNYGYEPVTPI